MSNTNLDMVNETSSYKLESAHPNHSVTKKGWKTRVKIRHHSFGIFQPREIIFEFESFESSSIQNRAKFACRGHLKERLVNGPTASAAMIKRALGMNFQKFQAPNQ